MLCASVIDRPATFQSRCSDTGDVYVDWNDGYDDQAPKDATHVHGSIPLVAKNGPTDGCNVNTKKT